MKAAHVPSSQGSRTPPIRQSHLFGWAFILAGPSIFLHEAGHWLAARMFGHEVSFEPTRIVNVGVFEVPAFEQAIRSGAGPVVSIVLAIIGYFLARSAWREFAAALMAGAVCRVVLILPYFVFAPLRALLGTSASPPNFDEFIFMRELGLPAWPMLVFLLPFLFWIARTIHQMFADHQPARSWAALLIGVASGVITWIKLLGPAVLT